MSTPNEALESLGKIRELYANSGQSEAKFEKAIAIAQAVVNAAISLKTAIPAAYPPKRIFRKKSRAPKSRIDRHKAMAKMFMAPLMARAEVMKITAMRMPNYPKGSPHGGTAIVGERGTEIILPRG